MKSLLTKRRAVAASLVLLIVFSVAFAQSRMFAHGASIIFSNLGAIAITPRSGQGVTVGGPLTTTGQALFTKDPASTSASAASVYINPATSAANEPLLTIADNGTSRATVDKEGDATFVTATVADAAYGAGWNGSSNVPTKNAVYDEIEAIRPCKVYMALLAQDGTDAPVVTVIKNTLGGTVVWTRVAQGEYVGTLAGAFPAAKTFGVGGYSRFSETGGGSVPILQRNSTDNAIKVTAEDDGALVSYPLKIEVCP